jgi:hypothetical protein
MNDYNSKLSKQARREYRERIRRASRVFSPEECPYQDYNMTARANALKAFKETVRQVLRSNSPKLDP